MKPVIRLGRVSVLRDEGTLLLQDHYQELALHKEVARLNPDWEEYQRLENAGRFKLVIARDDGGRLIGYAGFFLAFHLHYKELLVATNDVIFLAKEYREGGVGLELIRECERLLRTLGVQKAVWHAKKETALAGLLPRMGYEVEDILLSKVLEV